MEEHSSGQKSSQMPKAAQKRQRSSKWVEERGNSRLGLLDDKMSSERTKEFRMGGEAPKLSDGALR